MSRRVAAKAGAARPAIARDAPPPTTRDRRRAKPGGPLTRMAAKLNARVATQTTVKPVKAKASTRRGKKGLVLYVDPEVARALRRLALDTGESVQALGLAALSLLFSAHGLPPLSANEDAR